MILGFRKVVLNVEIKGSKSPMTFFLSIDSFFREHVTGHKVFIKGPFGCLHFERIEIYLMDYAI